ncbi:hypothetical protein KVK87_04565 [Helicobacter pylori]|nr:hypothetical protein KVK87_04565 [Helicobacter pylori]
MIEGDNAIITTAAEIKTSIGVIFKARATDLDIRAFKIHVRFLCPCIAVIKARLIDSDIVSRVKIERGPTAISV